MTKSSESWGSRVGLILAMAGNAVGLGNFLRFPVQAVQNGGGAFIIPYLVSFLLMGIPLLWVEWSMGRYGGRYGDHSTPFILDNMTKKRFWKYFGIFGIFTNIGVMAYYTYIESWTLTYTLKSIKGDFLGVDIGQVGAIFDRYVDISGGVNVPGIALVAFIVTLGINIYILSRGLSGGIEKVAKIAMPLLIVFGAFLAIMAITMGSTGRCADCNSHLGLDFLWTPDYSSLKNPKVWLAAAGQIFFTLSVGMGTIQCYSSYVKQKDDIALNAMSAGWMNGFVEIVLGASVVIPIAVGYLGLDWVKENAGFFMAFKTMPYLFDQWGSVLAILAGVAWFGLLFFAGITSSLAMGTPWMGFVQDEFSWSRNKSAWTLGIVVLLLALPTIFFYEYGVFDEYDYWTGTVSLVVFALAEVILFAWVFGMDKGWAEINEGADMRVPMIYKFIIKYITPVFILIIFTASLITPQDNDWKKAFSDGWKLDKSSIIGQILHIGVDYNTHYFSSEKQIESSGTIDTIGGNDRHKAIVCSTPATYYHRSTGSIVKHEPEEGEYTAIDTFELSTLYVNNEAEIIVKPGDAVEAGQVVAKGSFINRIFFIDLSRFILLLTFVGLGFMVKRASNLRKSNHA
ncbi:MAG: sodium-dependent transporter [Flavobacteriales bacterium]|nr:sodium-dependent transporter [Bacteroidota bacterium]MCB9239500.1 sodium-dependent transporter [Flavobacteriales bacterium]